MLKSSTILVLCLMLVSSIVVPAVVSLIESETETILAWDFGEEENQNEGKEVSGEKDFFAVELPSFPVWSHSASTRALIPSWEIPSAHIQEIPSPPPEV